MVKDGGGQRHTRLGLFALAVLLGFCSSGSAERLDSSYFSTTPRVTLECACGEPITKVIIQEVNRTVMVPDFVPYKKTFARIQREVIQVPNFQESMEEILEADFKEQHVNVINVEYDWKEVRKRMPIYNKKTVQIDDYELEPVDYVNQQVSLEPVVVTETEISEGEEEEVQETEIEYNVTTLLVDEIQYDDYKVIVDQVVYQDVVEYVEKVEYRDTEVYVWQVELYDEVFLQKQVQTKPAANRVEVDEVRINKKSVPIPKIRYNPRPVVIHDPVEIIETPVPYPEFYNQTYKVPRISSKVIPVPRYRDVQVEVPTYVKSPCQLPVDSTSFIPEDCSCNMCQPCAVCPVDAAASNNIPSYAALDQPYEGGYNEPAYDPYLAQGSNVQESIVAPPAGVDWSSWGSNLKALGHKLMYSSG